MKNNFYNNYPLLNVYLKDSLVSEITTQILYGEKFKILIRKKKWLKIKLFNDNYEGYIFNKKYLSKLNPTHKVCKLKSNIFYKPEKSKKTKVYLPYASRVEIIDKKDKYLKMSKNRWILKKDTKLIKFKYQNFFKDIKYFKNIKYKWGGKSYKGIDCSGLIQLMLNFNNQFCPRDTKDQVKYFQKKIKINRIKKNDLIFWKGHVALVLSKKFLIHAYGPYKKVIIMNIKKAIKKILLSAKLKVLSIKRI